jgi:hypothetical protein
MILERIAQILYDAARTVDFNIPPWPMAGMAEQDKYRAIAAAYVVRAAIVGAIVRGETED